ncbi:TonB family protein [Hymenobacter lapidiphilus]|uniref:energy transducer TonB n=1 Tax=Hymenobacter sp. CCM 8763 TaxID=2303334 RepID=UPI000E34EA15|nr:energy transducer TonB [Hymenobacter sp. CCM 8763]RFP66812.1 TonB family protein [Hymenobacter sp. CCM 8763]
MTVQLLLCLLLLSSISAAAQKAMGVFGPVDTVVLRNRPAATLSDEKDGLYEVITSESYQAIVSGGAGLVICDELPTYQKRNRKDNLALFIQQNLRYPSPRICVDGRVFVSFIVGNDGRVYRAKVLKGLHPLFDTEALRVIQLLSGHFTPAVCGGRARPHEMVLPVVFGFAD